VCCCAVWQRNGQRRESYNVGIPTGLLSSNHYGAAVSTMTWIYAGRSGVQILAGATELSILQNIQDQLQHPTSLQFNKIQSFSLAVKWPEQTV
jgi:hypothetical protein